MNKKLIIISAGAIGLIIIAGLLLVFLSGGNTPETVSNSLVSVSSRNAEDENDGYTMEEDPASYFKIVSRDLIRYYNTYKFNDYGNLDTVALQSTPELSKKIVDYKKMLQGSSDPTLSLLAVVDDSSFLLKTITGTTATTEVDLKVYSIAKGQSSQKSLRAEMEFAKQGNEWLLNQISYKDK